MEKTWIRDKHSRPQHCLFHFSFFFLVIKNLGLDPYPDSPKFMDPYTKLKHGSSSRGSTDFLALNEDFRILQTVQLPSTRLSWFTG
jgi:hypothetical protein